MVNFICLAIKIMQSIMFLHFFNVLKIFYFFKDIQLSLLEKHLYYNFKSKLQLIFKYLIHNSIQYAFQYLQF